MMLNENTKYFITVDRSHRETNKIEKYQVRIKNIFRCPKTGSITRVTYHDLNPDPHIKRSKDHFTSIPSEWIVKAETLYDVLGHVMIDDIVFTIEEYL